jgi:nitroreductase
METTGLAGRAAPPPTLPLTPDDLLSTTRSVRRRLDLSRPVPRALIARCLELALQAPTGSNMQNWRWVVVDDPASRRAIAEQYRRGWEIYKTLPIAAGNLPTDSPGRAGLQRRIMASAQYLADHFHEVPAFLIPCITPRVADEVPVLQCSFYGSVIQAAWSFQLAARARGLGTCWTTLHLFFEREVAEALGIPYDEVQQVALIAVGYSLGTGFRPAPREPLEGKLHWNAWSGQGEAG